MSGAKFNLPQFQQIRLRGFTLYSERREIIVDTANGVTCLVGANGIGKSTFVAAVNFGLCGRIPEPNRSFSSTNEYFNITRTFSESYFDGRISEFDRQFAQIELVFTIGADKYHTIRNAFAPDTLTYATLNQQPLLNTHSTNLPDSYESYKAAVAKSVGVSTFEQYVFLQLFIFTFDEHRHLTFWERPVQRQMLLLCFGTEIHDAQKAEMLRRDIERLESRARNANYQAKEFQKRLQDAQRILRHTSPDAVDLRKKRETLDESLDSLNSEAQELLDTLSDSELRVEHCRAEAKMVAGQLDALLDTELLPHTNLRLRPTIANSIESGHCQICGATGDSVAPSIESRISQSYCPLCGESLPKKPTRPELAHQLGELDQGLANLNLEIRAESNRQQRVQSKLRKVRAAIVDHQHKIEEFDRQHRDLPKYLGSIPVPELEDTITTQQAAIKELEDYKVKVRSERDKLALELRDIQNQISLQYSLAEIEFLNTFKEFARAFVGLDLDIRFDTQRNDMRLVLEMEGHSRRQHYQLSESQRFFVDIALRMAIISFISIENTSTFIVDTPEGSLDIAYESRAGMMFANFVKKGHDVIMTANINTSQLLRQLAKRCGAENMSVERMTEWTALSEVQIAAFDLFQMAYDEIEKDLKQPQQEDSP
ncbi:MAG: AAA family ATPase [Caldilineaceae bacterium]|nr:AAA family ATPase [Caldilineaceae bacterium]